MWKKLEICSVHRCIILLVWGNPMLLLLSSKQICFVFRRIRPFQELLARIDDTYFPIIHWETSLLSQWSHIGLPIYHGEASVCMITVTIGRRTSPWIPRKILFTMLSKKFLKHFNFIVEIVHAICDKHDDGYLWQVENAQACCLVLVWCFGYSSFRRRRSYDK